MAKKEDVYLALEMFHSHRPQKTVEELYKSEIGSLAVLKHLHKINGEAKSVDISKIMGISSARMAVLLKKLESRGLIVKSESKTDARAVMIKLSEKGENFVGNLKERMYGTMEKIVDEFGIERLTNMLMDLSKINKILEENMPIDMEENNA